MDIVLIILTIALIAILVAAYLLNRVPKIANLDKLFTNIQLTDPSVVAFTLRYDETTKKYTNVSRNDKGQLIQRTEAYPVNNLGSYIISKDHGVVEDLDRGFRISGFDFAKFDCPSGYEGPTCKAKPLCVSGTDDGKLKPLTYTQFNDLHLSYNSSDLIGLRRKREAAASETTHPRIRVQCLSNGRYELQSCPDNKLLNDSLQCEPYDICQDKLSGYKHNLPISKNSDALQADQYYICNNGVSEKTSCGDGSIFSAASSTCIIKSECSGKGDATLPRDDNSFVQCFNDTGTIVYCQNGITVDASGKYSCVVSTCEPRIMTYDDNIISYAYGRMTCDNNIPSTIQCDTATRTKSFNYEWALPFSYNVEHWPAETLNLATGLCEPTKTDIIKDAVLMPWSEAMSASYKFDLTTENYICDSNARFRWDYLRGVTVPQTTQFVDTGAPCQTAASASAPWREFQNNVQYPKSVSTKPFTIPKLLVGEPVNFPFYGWPTYIAQSKIYKIALISVEARSMIVTTYEMDVPPLGFIHNENNAYSLIDRDAQLLDLVGFGVPENAQNYNWFTIASGKFEQIRCSGTKNSKIEYPIESEISLLAPGEYSIMWPDLIDAKAPFATDIDDKKYYATRQGLRLADDTVIYNSGYTILSVSAKDKDNVVVITLSPDLSIKIRASMQAKITLNYV